MYDDGMIKNNWGKFWGARRCVYTGQLNFIQLLDVVISVSEACASLRRQAVVAGSRPTELV